MLIEFEDMFCTLEQAEKLKKLGVKQESHFYWFKPYDFFLINKNDRDNYLERYPDCLYSAFSVTEILFLLPKYIELLITKEGAYRLDYQDYSNLLIDEKITLPNALVFFILDMIEDGKITVDEINARFN